MICISLVRRTVLIAALTLTPCIAAAQTAEGPAARGNRPLVAPSNAELITMLDAYAIVQAQNALELNDSQYGQFVARLKRLQETRRRNGQARNRLLVELRKLTAGAGADDNAIRERLKTLRELDEQAAQTLRRDYDAVDEVLDVRQQARFRIFEERLERQKLDLLMRARDRAARGAQRRNGDR
jgi:hypothetical protein